MALVTEEASSWTTPAWLTEVALVTDVAPPSWTTDPPAWLTVALEVTEVALVTDVAPPSWTTGLEELVTAESPPAWLTAAPPACAVVSTPPCTREVVASELTGEPPTSTTKVEPPVIEVEVSWRSSPATNSSYSLVTSSLVTLREVIFMHHNYKKNIERTPPPIFRFPGRYVRCARAA